MSDTPCRFKHALSVFAALHAGSSTVDVVASQIRSILRGKAVLMVGARVPVIVAVLGNRRSPPVFVCVCVCPRQEALEFIGVR